MLKMNTILQINISQVLITQERLIVNQTMITYDHLCVAMLWFMGLFGYYTQVELILIQLPILNFPNFRLEGQG